LAAVSRSDWANLLLRLFADLASIGLLSLMVARRRPRRGLFMVYASFNIGLFAVLTVITREHVGPAIGFGLFAMLSIVRLRSEPFSNSDLAYFFCALVLALVNGIRIDEVPFQVLLSVVLITTLFLVDHPALYRPTARRTITLDTIAVDEEALRVRLTEDLGVEVLEVAIEEIDYVRDLTRVQIRHAVARPAT
jgi:hypothetical protein